MALTINDNNLIINIPNSEAGINAQHYGIKDRTVGMYYLSEMCDTVTKFLSLEDNNSKYFIDLTKTYNNSFKLYSELTSRNLNQAFKSDLQLMKITLDSIIKHIEEGNDFCEIEKPTINDQRKYIKFNYENAYYSSLKDVCLGDLSKIVIQRLSNNCFRIYMDIVDNFYELLNNGTIAGWCNKK